MKRSTRSGLACLALGLSALGLRAETTLELAFGGNLSGGSMTPFASAAIDGVAQRIKGDSGSFYSRLSVDASHDLLGAGYSGSASLELATYRIAGRANLGARLETSGTLPSDSADGSLVAALSLPVTLNALALSLSIAPELAVDPLSAGYLSFGIEGGLSFVAGDFVLKPGFGVSAIRPWSGGVAVALKPALEISWYPGFPASASLSGEYRIGGDSAGDSLGFELSGVAAPGDRLLLTLTADGSRSSTSSSLETLLECAFSVAGDDVGRNWSIPLRVGYLRVDGSSSFLVGAGARFAF